MKKLLTDRLNELKSELAELRQLKLTKLLQLEKMADVLTRIDEVNRLIHKING